MDFGEAIARSSGLNTVRALRQTIIALREALEQSKSDILDLKSKTWPEDSVPELSIDNHVLNNQIVNVNTECQTEKPEENLSPFIEQEQNVEPPEKPSKKVTIVTPTLPEIKERCFHLETKISIKSKNNRTSRSLESLTVLKSPIQAGHKVSFKKTLSFSNLASVKREVTVQGFVNNKNTEMSVSRDNSEDTPYDENLLSPQNDLDQEVDDIELIFTTDDTKDQDFKEELVPIDATGSNSNLLNFPLSDMEQVSDRELDDDVFNDDEQNNYQQQQSFEIKRDNSIFNSRSDNSIDHEKSLKSYCSYQDSSFENKSLEKDESFDRFEERVRIVETDISKCGIHEVEYLGTRRNTCPNPIQYRPLAHRYVAKDLDKHPEEADCREAVSRGLTSRKMRPILTHSNAIRRESGAQTDISAIPDSAWRSESSLANKVYKSNILTYREF